MSHDEARSTEAAAASSAPRKRRAAAAPSDARAERRFQRELRAMMFGFGDSANPLPQSVELMEDLMVDYVQQVLHKASEACETRNMQSRRASESKNVSVNDLLFVVRKDRRRQKRVSLT